MGMNVMGGRKSECACPAHYSDGGGPRESPYGNPNPSRFSIRKVQECGRHVVAWVHYPDAKNFEGSKILVLRTSATILGKAWELDPHFCDRAKLPLIARFVPTQEGWELAVMFAKSIG